jgi:hypothetical protein
MHYRYLLMSGILSSFVLISSAWAGAGDGQGVQFERAKRETELPHVCKGGPDHGKACTVTLNNTAEGVVVEPPGCAGAGQCVVKYISWPIPCRLSLHADADLLPEDATEEAFETLAITLMVKKDGEEHFFSNTLHLPLGEFSPETFETLIINSTRPDSDKYLFRGTKELSDEVFFHLIDPDDSMGDGLRALFDTVGRPVISTVGERIIESDHTDDPLASLVVLNCELQFVPASGIGALLPPPVITK